MPRRKPGSLLPLEIEILLAAAETQRQGHPAFHGFGLARTMREHRATRSLTAHGTLYKALARLEAFGMLVSRWEDQPAAAGSRPRRRLYELTGEGARVAERARGEAHAVPLPRPHAGPEPA